MMTEEIEAVNAVELTLNDRCDSCQAAAKHMLIKQIEGKQHDLLFCGHHYNKFEPQILVQGWAAV